MYKWVAQISVNDGEYYSAITFLAEEASIGQRRDILDIDGYYYHSEFPLYFDGKEICFYEPIESLSHD